MSLRFKYHLNLPCSREKVVKSLLSYLYLCLKKTVFKKSKWYLTFTVPDQAPNTRYAEAPLPSRYQPEPSRYQPEPSRYQPEPSRYQPEPEPEPAAPPPAPAGGGGRYIALYDYTAADDDEVSYSYLISKSKISKNRFSYDEMRPETSVVSKIFFPVIDVTLEPLHFIWNVCHAVQ